MLRPCARQAPKIDASVILVAVPRSERVPPLTLRLTTRWRRLRSAALLSGGTSGSATKTKFFDEEFFDVVLHASAQPGLDRRRVIRKGTAEDRQSSFQGHFGGAALLLCGVGKGRGLTVELVDGVSPPGQQSISWVE